jgi:hypothetical protein
MDPDVRQTLIGVTGLTIVFTMALYEGFNGRVTVTYAIAVIALAAPQALNEFPTLGGEQ